MKYFLLFLPIFAQAQDSDYVQFEFTEKPCILTDPQKTNLKTVKKIEKNGKKIEGCYVEILDKKVAVFKEE